MKLKHLNQTNKTILFAKVNGRKDSLKTLLDEEKSDVKAISDQTLKNIEEKLCVKSFEEFLKKFEPVVYSKFYNTNIICTLDPENVEDWKKHPITITNAFLKAMIETIEGKIGMKNIEFNYDRCLELLGIKSQVKQIYGIRNEIMILEEKFSKAEEDSLEKEKYEQLLSKKFHEIAENYGNPLSLMPYCINEIQEVIEKKKMLVMSTNIDNIRKELGASDIIFIEHGQVRIKSKEDKMESIKGEILDEHGNVIESIKIEEKQKQCQLALLRTYEYYQKEHNLEVRKDIENMLSIIFQSDKERKLFYESKSLSDLCEECNRYQELMDRYLETFIATAKPLIETIIGIKTFFDQSKIKINKMPVELLISNCDINDISEQKLEPFLEATNHTIANVNHMIWFSIIPNVEMLAIDSEKKLIPNFFQSEKKVIKKENKINSKETVVKLIKVLANYDIQVFINFENTEKNTFSYVSQYGIQDYINVTESMKKDNDIASYIIPCLPNFTILPEKNSKMRQSLYYNYQSDEVIESCMKSIDLGGVYIGAAFVAAGITAAYQSPDYLNQKKLSVLERIPGVRFDLEKYFDKINTTIGIEISGYSDKIKSEINQNQFGFVFASEGGAKVKVLKARCLKMEDNDRYEQIFKRTTLTYIEKFFKNSCADSITKSNVEAFLGENMKKVFWKKYSSEGYVNALLQENDDIEYSIENGSCQITLNLKEIEKQLEIKISN